MKREIYTAVWKELLDRSSIDVAAAGHAGDTQLLRECLQRRRQLEAKWLKTFLDIHEDELV